MSEGAEKISERIYEHMRAHHMCQAAVARAAGMTPRVFNDILRGRRILKAEQLLSICNALECTPNDILGIEERR